MESNYTDGPMGHKMTFKLFPTFSELNTICIVCHSHESLLLN